MKHWKLHPLLALIWLSVLCGSNAFAELDLRNATVDRLDNGLTVILLEDRNFPVVSVEMLYRSGGRDESYGHTGIAHFVEHMAFRDSKNFPDSGLISAIYARGGEWHGYTSRDETVYFATAPKEDRDLLLRIEADRMGRLKISEDHMAAEIGAVLAEMHSYENDPMSILSDAVMFTSFFGHPYRNNIIGWESDIENLQHADVVAFYERHYHPANAVLAVVGDFVSGEMLSRIKELFGDFERKSPTPLPHTVEPTQEGERRVHFYGDTDSKQFRIAYRAPSIQNDDYAAFLVLQKVLGAEYGQNGWGERVTEGSILHGAADEMAIQYPRSAQDYAFIIGGRVGGNVSEQDVEQEIERRLTGVRQQAPNRELVAASIAKVFDQMVYEVATTEDAAHRLASFAGLHALDKLHKLPELVAAVSESDVQRVAQRWLSPRRRTIGWYVPDKNPNTQHHTAAAHTPQKGVTRLPPAPLDTDPLPMAVTERLNGGVPVIVQQSDMTPSAYVQVILQGSDIASHGIVANDPVLGHSALSWLIRPDDLQATLLKARKAVDEVTVASDSRYTPSDIPVTRLEQEFSQVMKGATGEDQAAATPIQPAVIVISGDVSRKETLELLKESFGDLQAQPKQLSVAGHFKPEDTAIALGRPIAQAQIGYIVPAPKPTDAQSYAYRMLLYILSHDYEGRLGKEAIANRGLAYKIGSSYRSNGSNGWITLSVGVDPKKVAPLKSLIEAELERLHAEPPTVEEVEEAKAYVVGRAISSAQSNEELSKALAEEWLWYGTTKTPQEVANTLSAISRKQVLDIIPEFINGATIVVAE